MIVVFQARIRNDSTILSRQQAKLQSFFVCRFTFIISPGIQTYHSYDIIQKGCSHYKLDVCSKNWYFCCQLILHYLVVFSSPLFALPPEFLHKLNRGFWCHGDGDLNFQLKSSSTNLRVAHKGKAETILFNILSKNSFYSKNRHLLYLTPSGYPSLCFSWFNTASWSSPFSSGREYVATAR